MSELTNRSVLEPEIQECPFPYYKALREDTPVKRTPDGSFIVTSYDLILQVVQNHKTYSSMSPQGGLGPHQCAAAEKLIADEGFGRSMPVFVNNDPPSHTVYRRLAMSAFRIGRIRQMESYIVTTASQLLDQIENCATADVVASFAIPMQLYVIADQLGIARTDFKKFREWSDAWLIGLSLPVAEEVHLEAAKKVVELQHYLMARINERRAEPRDDIISDLVAAEFSGVRPLTNVEVLAIAENILVAGNETTSNSIGMGLLRLAQDQTLQKRLRTDLESVPKFVDEVLRSDAPVQMMPRYATVDTELGGVQIPKGSVVMAAFGAGNRDVTKFADSESFDIDRPNLSRHLSFGSGIHSCVGSPLARLVLTKSFQAFLKRFSSFRLAEPEAKIEYNPSFVLRGLKHLVLALEASPVESVGGGH